MRRLQVDKIQLGLAIVGLVLAGCDSKPLTTSAPPAQEIVPDSLGHKRRSAGTGRPAVAAADTLRRLLAPGSDSAAMPARHTLRASYRKTVAAGLDVIISDLPPAATAVIRDPWDLRVTFTITHQGTVIYRDTATGMTYHNEDMPPGMRRRYPLWIPSGPDSGELLMAFDNRPSKELARRFRIRQGQVVGLDTLPVFEHPARNLDADPALEYSGLIDYGEMWTDEQGRLRKAYNPVLYYEVRPAGLFLDSALTKRKAQAAFGAFYGFSYSTAPVLLEKTRQK